MAKVIYGPIISEARGKLGDIILNRNRGGNFARALSLTPPAAAPLQGASIITSDDVELPTETETIISFDTELYDIGGLHDPTTNPTRLTIKSAGVYLVAAAADCEYPDPQANFAYIQKNSTTTLAFQALNHTTSDEITWGLAWLGLLAANDYIEFTIYNRGASSAYAYFYSPWTPLFTVQQLTAT